MCLDYPIGEQVEKNVLIKEEEPLFVARCLLKMGKLVCSGQRPFRAMRFSVQEIQNPGSWFVEDKGWRIRG